MKPKSLLTTFEHTLGGRLDNHDLGEAHMQLNHYHYGERLIPLNIPQVNLPGALVDASYNIHRGFSMKVWVDLYSDGTFRCRPQKDGD